MANLHFTRQAIEDLTEIWNYTFDNWSEKQADKYYNLLFRACQEIARNPKKGKPYHEIGVGIFGFLAYRHLIMYRTPTPRAVEILRILHAQMDIKSKFL